MVNRSRWRRAFDALFPYDCLLCQLPSNCNKAICDACESELPWLGAHCRQCALPLPPGSSAIRCGQCLKRPPAFARCLCPLRYDFPVGGLINQFKHHGQLAAGALLGELWLEACHDRMEAAQPDLLVPVPLHWRRRWRRGYNQAELLAEQWSSALKIPMARAAKRSQGTAAQQGLSASQRRRNLRGAFSVTRPADLSGKHLAVVDDVLTTGATAHSLAAILTRCGACRVDIWCLARTP